MAAKLLVTVNSVPVEVSISDEGNFAATVNEEHCYADTLDKLKGQISRKLRAAKIELAIPVVLRLNQGYGYAGYVRAQLRGRHGRTSEWLFTLADGSKIRESYPQIELLGDEISDANLAELNRLAQEAERAKKAERDYLRAQQNPAYSAHDRSLSVLVQKAQDAALGKEAIA